MKASLNSIADMGTANRRGELIEKDMEREGATKDYRTLERRSTKGIGSGHAQRSTALQGRYNVAVDCKGQQVDRIRCLLKED